MAQTTQPETQLHTLADRILRAVTILWFLIAAFGQLAFIDFIVRYYYTRTFSGNYPGWNDKELIDGYIAGDVIGNVMFALHVLLAAVITLGGLLQLIPQLRRVLPWFHRWNGRVFMVIAYFMALGGIWLGWVRGTSLSDISNWAISINAVLILLFATTAWRLAATDRIEAHRRWALRTFMVVNGVWFLRVGMMGWVIVNQGPVGMDGTLSGPADILLVFGCYLIPLLGLEAYFAAQRSGRDLYKNLTSLLILALTVFMAIGIFGTIMFMWRPVL